MSPEPIELTGAYGGLELIHGTDGCPADAPVIVGAEAGFSCLAAELEHPGWDPSERESVLRAAAAIRASSEGQWLAVTQGSGGTLGLVQTNRGTFYETHHPNAYGPIWGDFYFRAAHVIHDLLDRAEGHPDVRLLHPTGWGWPAQLAESWLDGLAHLLDSRELATERVWVDREVPCGLRQASALKRAVEAIDSERAGNGRGATREFAIERSRPQALGISSEAPVDVWRVDVLERRGSELS